MTHNIFKIVKSDKNQLNIIQYLTLSNGQNKAAVLFAPTVFTLPRTDTWIVLFIK